MSKPIAASLGQLCAPREPGGSSFWLFILSFALCVGYSAAVFGRGGGMGGMGLHHSAVTGGSSGSSANAPGTDSLGTALSSGGAGSAEKGQPLGAGNPAVDREDKRVAKIVHSICVGR